MSSAASPDKAGPKSQSSVLFALASMILFSFSWIGVLSVVFTRRNLQNIPFDEAIGPRFFLIWSVMGLAAAPLCALAWWLILSRTGRIRLGGLWLRLLASVFQVSVLWSFFVATIGGTSDTVIYARSILIAAAVFSVVLVGRDVKVLIDVGRLANE